MELVKLTSQCLRVNRLSKLFQPLNIKPSASESQKKLLSKGQQLMLDMGIIHPAGNGIYHLLPLGLRTIGKIKNIIRQEMYSIDAQEVKLSHIIDSQLWKKSGRLENENFGFFSVGDRHGRNYLLNPTNEEAVAELLSQNTTFSYQNLPLMLYQISTKFRDEVKPRFGLLRSREFLMYDLYSLDKCEEDAQNSYDVVSSAYEKIFKKIGVDVVKACADSGEMGGFLSHEYHILTDIGEDDVYFCQECTNKFNSELLDIDLCCPQCSSKSLTFSKGIEVGHTFLLGSRYTEPLKATFKKQNGDLAPMIMGSYGIGVTRLLAAAVESSCTKDQIRWPFAIAPYLLIIITPKHGSNESQIGEKLGLELYQELSKISYMSDNILMDDRGKFTIGKKLLQAKNIGYPLVLVLGSKIKSEPPIIEIHDLNNEKELNLTISETIKYCSTLNIAQ